LRIQDERRKKLDAEKGTESEKRGGGDLQNLLYEVASAGAPRAGTVIEIFGKQW